MSHRRAEAKTIFQACSSVRTSSVVRIYQGRRPFPCREITRKTGNRKIWMLDGKCQHRSLQVPVQMRIPDPPFAPRTLASGNLPGFAALSFLINEILPMREADDDALLQRKTQPEKGDCLQILDQRCGSLCAPRRQRFPSSEWLPTCVSCRREAHGCS